LGEVKKIERELEMFAKHPHIFAERMHCGGKRILVNK
jgi:hypothetical protein